jgi:tRNA nucleotidyltransferase (CCA-adding enzyme)
MIRLKRKEITGVRRRLRIPAYLENIILASNRLWRNQSEFINAPPSILFDHLSDAPALAVYGFFLSTGNEIIREAVRNYAENWQYITLSIDGNDLKEMGIPPGPIYRRILTRMKAGRLDGKFKNEAEEKKYLEIVLETINDEK